ncbi:hypothetical protein BCR32DRAFT_296461 [Anaeromyces robustus]|uniref:BLOC-1-related complex subunit 6 C-terminal helix domain-containing protein n=1 Tax=Anaeromyces robustus TaxID=1754192 RepID=A0A1Y1WRU2_9FUNG|nr:hypothetical protein BCR32DRAFT_296461 [Anaeromyces robustus]|eukprot:ORX76105.1 hypothetical protein BCR32DRAFT_296461 [Anaeromyces robustus]
MSSSSQLNNSKNFELTSIYREKSTSKNIPFDLNLIDNLEKNAEGISIEIHRMVASLQDKLSTMSQSTLESIHVQNTSAKKIDNLVTESIEQTEQMMNLCDTLNKDMDKIYELSDKIKQIQESLKTIEEFLL